MVNELAGPLLARLEGQQEEMVSLLADLAELESPSDEPATQEGMLARLTTELESCGLQVRRFRGRKSGGALLAFPPRSIRSGRPLQLLLGHADTIWPSGSLATMPVVLRDGRLYGPGVFDMKGGLVQALFALRALAALGHEMPAYPAVFINTDEEIGSVDSGKQVRHLAHIASRVFVLEPSLGPDGRLKTRRKGVGQFVLTARGKAAHAGLEPERGASAVLALAKAVIRIADLADPSRGIDVNVGVISGGLRGNVVAPTARADVDVRVVDPEQGEELTAKLASLVSEVPGTLLEVTGGFDRPPLLPNPRNRALFERAQLVGRALDLAIEEGTAGGASDGNTTSLFTATLDGLGAVGGGAHADHEHVEVDRLPERAALLSLLLLSPLEAQDESGSPHA
jgi:glutamate carboxypeptidase